MNDWLIRSKSGPIMIKHHPTLDVWCLSSLRWATDIEQKHNTSKTEKCKAKYGFSRWEDVKRYTKITNRLNYERRTQSEFH